jgi:hypothetical protein
VLVTMPDEQHPAEHFIIMEIFAMRWLFHECPDASDTCIVWSATNLVICRTDGFLRPHKSEMVSPVLPTSPTCFLSVNVMTVIMFCNRSNW